MTVAAEPDIRYRMIVGRRQINHEQMPARLPAGTVARMEAVLNDGEKRADLLREAIERELRRRERRREREA